MSRPLLAGQPDSTSNPDAQDSSDDESVKGDPGVFYFHEGELYEPYLIGSRARSQAKAFRGTAFGMMPDHPIREMCIKLMCNTWVDRGVLALIVFNCVFMLFQPSTVIPGSPADVIAGHVEWGCMAIFTVELLIKLVACGLAFHEGAFLHDPWNLLDLAVVGSFWIVLLLPNIPSLASLRMARALRPLRTIQRFPELRRVVEAFFRAGPALSTVSALTAFFILVFGVIGVEVFAGAFHQRCEPTQWHEERSRNLRGSDALHVVEASNSEKLIQYCGHNASVCPADSGCFNHRANPDPTVTFGNLDGIRQAAVVVLQWWEALIA